jgi:hypothetical protein
MMAQNGNEQPQHTHQVIADGVVIYEGEDWAYVFLGAGFNPRWGKIVYVEDGKPGAQWGPPLAPDALARMCSN